MLFSYQYYIEQCDAFFVLFIFCVSTLAMFVVCPKEFHFTAYVVLKHVSCGTFIRFDLGHMIQKHIEGL